MEEEKDIVTQAELARRLNVSPPYINKLVRQGVLKLNDKKKLSVIESKKRIEESSDPSRAYKKKTFIVNKIIDSNPELTEEQKIDLQNVDDDFFKDITGLSYNDSKTKSEQYNLILQKIKIEKELNNLVPVTDVRKNAFDLAKKLKDSLLAIPDRICDITASETDSRVIHNLITNEIKQTLEDVINELEKANDKK